MAFIYGKILLLTLKSGMYGEVSERFKEPVLKTGDSQEPRVRISSSPPKYGEVPKW